jgi:hypothetical protein
MTKGRSILVCTLLAAPLYTAPSTPFALTPPSPSPGGAAAHAHQHAKCNAPKPAARRHTLRTAGWTALPDHVSAFANEFAMPGTFTD